MTTLARSISLMMSKMREKNQFPELGRFTVQDDSVIFVQGETFNVNESEPFVLTLTKPFNEALSLTITYNGSKTYDMIVPKYTDIYQMIRIPDKAHEVNDVDIKILTITDETVVKGDIQSSDNLTEYASTLPSTIEDSNGVIYDINTHYELVDGEVSWKTGLNDPGGAIYDPLGTTITDYTSEISDDTEDDVPVFPEPGTAADGDLFYIGYDELFNVVKFTIGQAGVGDYSMEVEYWDGADWNQTLSGIVDETDSFRSVGDRLFQFKEPSSWVKRDVDTITDKYWIRFKLDNLISYSQRPILTQAWIDKEPYRGTEYTVSYDYVPGGESGYTGEFNLLRGNMAKMLYLHEHGMSQIRSISYTMYNYLKLSNATGDWLRKLAKSWDITPLGGDTDEDLQQKIINRSSSTNGTVISIREKLKNFLDLDQLPTITEAADSTSWILNESQLLGSNQSELVLSGGDTIKPMQIVVNISNYDGSYTEEDLEEYLRTILPVGTSPIVRL